MSPACPPHDKTAASGGLSQDVDDAEKGLYDHSAGLPVIPNLGRNDSSSSDEKTAIHVETALTPLSIPAIRPPASPVHEGLTPITNAMMFERTTSPIPSGLTPMTSTTMLVRNTSPLSGFSPMTSTTMLERTMSPIHEGLTPISSTTNLQLALSWPEGYKPKPIIPDPAIQKPQGPPPKPKFSRWILFRLWFNTYRQFFTFITLLNLTGIILTGLGKFQYAETHLGALVLGNLLMAILMRNELFLRFLYTVAIYGLRSVCVS
jgi:hypothetical protein